MRSKRGIGLVVAALAIGFALQSPASASAARPGTLDATFGVKGVAVVPSSTHHSPNVTNQPVVAWELAVAGQRLWVGGGQGDQDYVTRLTASGHADASFRSGRPYWAADGGFVSDGLVLPNGSGAYVVTEIGDLGNPDTAYVVTRLTGAGHVDQAWGDHGVAHVGPTSCALYDSCSPTITAGEILPDGRLRFAGSLDDLAADDAAGARTPIVAGLTASGAPDVTVGPNGWTRVASAPQAPHGGVDGAAFDGTGRAYFLYASARGFGCDNACASKPQLVRSSANGVLDTTYGVDGVAKLTLPAQGAVSSSLGGRYGAVLASPSGEIYVGLEVRLAGTGGKTEAVVQHLDRSGHLVTSFGHNGLARYAASAGSGSISAIASDGAGHLILGLTYSTSTTFSHLLLQVSAKTGSVSTSFGRNGAVASPVFVVAMARQSAHRLVVLGWPTSGRTNSFAKHSNSRLVRYVI